MKKVYVATKSMLTNRLFVIVSSLCLVLPSANAQSPTNEAARIGSAMRSALIEAPVNSNAQKNILGDVIVKLIRQFVHLQPIPANNSMVAGGNYRQTISVNGLKRDFIIHVPLRFRRGQASPVVVNFHAFETNAEIDMFLWALYAKADEMPNNPPIVVYPNGMSMQSAGINSGMFGTESRFWLTDGVKDNLLINGFSAPDANDAAFFDAMIDNLGSLLSIDRSRVYVSGFSQGGMFAYEVACKRAGKIAGMASVSGFLDTNNCAPSKPVPVIQITGTGEPLFDTAETLTNYCKGNASSCGFRVFVKNSAQKSVEFFAERNGCAQILSTSILDGNEENGTSVEVDTQNPCTAHGAVKHVRIVNGLHNWPGAVLQNTALHPVIRNALLGLWTGLTKQITTERHSANRMIFEFFFGAPLK